MRSMHVDVRGVLRSSDRITWAVHPQRAPAMSPGPNADARLLRCHGLEHGLATSLFFALRAGECLNRVLDRREFAVLAEQSRQGQWPKVSTSLAGDPPGVAVRHGAQVAQAHNLGRSGGGSSHHGPTWSTSDCGQGRRYVFRRLQAGAVRRRRLWCHCRRLGRSRAAGSPRAA